MTSRTLSAEEIETYQRDGVLLVENAVSDEWVETLSQVLERILESPGALVGDTGTPERNGVGRAFDARYLWKTHSEIERFLYRGGLASLVGPAMQSRAVRFYFDHWFVKEPGTGTQTPWHQDISYWPFSGRQIASVWLSLSDIDEASSPLEFVKGSHRWEKRFRAKRFVKSDERDNWLDTGEGDPLPDIGAEREQYDIFSAAMKPGDALIFSAWLVHAAPSNRSTTRRQAVSTRWLGDDVLWDPRPGTDPSVFDDDSRPSPGDSIERADRFPLIWESGVEPPELTIR